MYILLNNNRPIIRYDIHTYMLTFGNVLIFLRIVQMKRKENINNNMTMEFDAFQNTRSPPDREHCIHIMKI